MRAHILPGIAAAGCLKEARSKHGVAGEIFAISDCLDVGPLATDEDRLAWWKEIEDDSDDDLLRDMYSFHDQWGSVLGQVLARAEEVVIWTSDSGNDQIHLRLAAHKQESFGGRVSAVHVPTTEDGYTGVSRFWPKTLAECERHSVATSSVDLQSLARDYRDRWANSDGVRLNTDQGLELRDYSVFDEELLDNCPPEFVSPYKVIGYTLSQLDQRNWISYMFLQWRLRLLIGASRVETTGSRWPVGDCDIRVRRAHF